MMLESGDREPGGGVAGGEDLDARILAIALPALGALAIDPLLGVVDTFWVGRIPDPAPLAALGVCTSVFSFSFFVFNFLATATAPLIASSLAGDDSEEAERTLAQALTAGVVIGIASLLALEASAGPILRTMGTSAEAFDQAEGYLRIRALAAPAVLTTSVANGAFRGLLDSRTPLKAIAAANIVNFVLDPCFIFGVSAGDVQIVPAMGAPGAALATALAEGGAAALLLAQLAQNERVKGGVRLVTELPSLEQVAPLLQSSGAAFARSIAIQTVLASATGNAARLGTTAVAAHQVAAQLWLLLSFVCDSLAVAGQGLIADALGRGQVAGARAVADRLLILGLALGGGLMCVFLLGKEALPSLFTADASVALAVAPLLTYVAVMQPLNSLVFVGDGILQGSKDFGYLAGAMVVASAAALGVLGTGDGSLETVWRALIALQGARAVGLAWRYFGGTAAGGPLNAKDADSSSNSRE